MTELKTLKDLRKDRIRYFKKKLESFGCPDSYLENTAKSMALFLEKKDKQEAIKWLRHFQSGDIKTDLQRQGIMEFILNFFNIKEENLKGGKEK